MSFYLSALGEAIRTRRKVVGMTQQALGDAAGYQGGAGVTISRIEGGKLEPGSERLAKIATALGITAADLEAEALAARKTQNDAPLDCTTFEARLTRIKQVNNSRRQLSEAKDKFQSARVGAESAYLSRFRKIVAQLDDAPELPNEVEDGPVPVEQDAKAEASYQLRFTTYGVSNALAKSAKQDTGADEFMQGVGAWTAAAGKSVPVIGTAAAVRGFGAAMRPWNALGAVAALAGAAVAVGATAALLDSAAKRTRKQQEELSKKFDEIEADIAITQPGVETLLEVLPLATELLEYISVHGGHALNRWEITMGDDRELVQGGRDRYQQFVEIAAAQMAVSTLDVQGLLNARDEDRHQAEALARALIAEARDTVMAYV